MSPISYEVVPYLEPTGDKRWAVRRIVTDHFGYLRRELVTYGQSQEEAEASKLELAVARPSGSET